MPTPHHRHHTCQPSLRALTMLLLAFTAGGCATGYLADRGRDAADILTLTLGAGSGIKARVGPLQLAAIENTDLLGLRAGQAFANGGELVDNKEAYGPLPVFGDDNWNDPVVKSAFETGKHTVGEHRTPRDYIHDKPHYRDWSGTFGREVFQHDPESTPERRGKRSMATAPLPFWTQSPYPEHYTQIEVAGGLIFAIRLGINFGEIADFLLGIAAIDIYDDDLGTDR